MADPTLVERVDTLIGLVVACDGFCKSAAEVREAEECLLSALEEIWDDAFRAGAEQMREAAAKYAEQQTAPQSGAWAEGANHNASKIARSIRALPVPPAPSPAHDGKEGAQ